MTVYSTFEMRHIDRHREEEFTLTPKKRPGPPLQALWDGSPIMFCDIQAPELFGEHFAGWMSRVVTRGRFPAGSAGREFCFRAFWCGQYHRRTASA